jgi:hypothetical protein
MRKIFKLLTVILCAGFILFFTGCGNKSDNTVKISYEHGNGVFSVSVPKKADGTPKYEFTTEKPSEISTSATFYLVTDTAVFGFATNGMTYNTSVAYKEKYGETKATFDKYLEFIEDKELYNKSYLPGLEQFELNGRKALRYYNRVGGSGSYKYYGYFYMIGVDDLYPGSRAGMTVNYKLDEKPTEAQEFDEETLSIINSLTIEAKTE